MSRRAVTKTEFYGDARPPGLAWWVVGSALVVIFGSVWLSMLPVSP